MQSDVLDFQINRNGIKKKCSSFEINTTTKFLIFRMKYIIDQGAVYLIINTDNYIINPIRKLTYSFII